MRNVISIRVQNVPGVLSHVAGLLAARGYNVDSLTVGATEDPTISRMTIVLDVAEDMANQVCSQLQKLVTVVETENLSRVPHVERELALIRVATPKGTRSEIVELTNIFRAGVVDVGVDSVMIEISGRGDKLDAFIKALRPYRILNMTRSGCIAAARRQDSAVEEEDNK
ncbi:MAG: acetolactate synthase small subunit [Thermoguttaceae bacterium]